MSGYRGDYTHDETLLALTADIVAAHVGNNAVAANDVADVIIKVYAALGTLGQQVDIAAPQQEPAVSVRASVKPDYLVCLEDGKKLKMLKRHLMSHYQMTPAEYRAKWKLPADYPMVAPNYANKRKELALKIGLGKNAGRGGRKASAPKAALNSTPEPAAETRRTLKIKTES